MDYPTVSIHRPFLSENFLLYSETAERLYFEYAKDMPIIDYHNHLPPQQIAANYKFTNITEIWLNGDHYKWRALRSNGVNEHFITGKATDYEKYEKWMETLPFTMRNPLFHWSHMEMQRYFGIHEVLNSTNARRTFDICNEQLALPSHNVHGLLDMMNVKVVCTTDDPSDTLAYHAQHQSISKKGVKMLPSFRPDKYILIENPNYKSFVDKLGQAAEVEIASFDDLLMALNKRAIFFRLSSI